MEAGAAVYHGLGVLGDLLIQNSGRLVIQALDGILGAHRQAPGAAHALGIVDMGQITIHGDGLVLALLRADAAAQTYVFVQFRYAAEG